MSSAAMSVPARIVPRSLPLSPEPYRILLRDRGWVAAVAPMPLAFEGFEHYDLFSHAIEGGHRVSERLTGLAIVSDGEGMARTFGTRGEAVGAAAEYLGRFGADKFVGSVVRVLNARRGDGR